MVDQILFFLKCLFFSCRLLVVGSKQKLILFSFQLISASFQSYYFCFIFFVVLWYHLFTVLMIENISYVIILDDEFMMAILPPFPFISVLVWPLFFYRNGVVIILLWCVNLLSSMMRPTLLVLWTIISLRLIGKIFFIMFYFFISIQMSWPL